MKIKLILILFILLISSFCVSLANALDTPTITATAKGPNQINLTWSAVSNPGWGYKVEIQSSGDSRYLSWTGLSITRDGRTYLPYWVTESHYTDITDGSGSSMGSAAQFQMYGLIYGILYNFRVRTYGQTDAGVDTYGSYSNTASATTTTPSTIRYVVPGGAGAQNGTSWANAWPTIQSANGVTSGTLVLIGGTGANGSGTGNYPSATLVPTNSGTQANRIIFQGNPGATITITSFFDIALYGIYLATNYIVIDGIAILPSIPLIDANGTVIFEGATRCALVNSEVRSNGTSTPTNISAVMMGYGASSYNLMHYCYLHDVATNTEPDPSGDGLLFTLSSASRSVIQYNHFARGGHDTGSIYNGSSYNQYKNNQVDGGWGLGIEILGDSVSGSYNLIEGNLVKDVGKNLNCTGCPKPALEVGFPHTTIRRNILADSRANTGGVNDGSGIEVNGQHFDPTGSLIYNNTIVNNGRIGICNFSSTSSIQVKNNAIYGNLNAECYNDCNPYQILLYVGFSGWSISHNLILASPSGVDSPSVYSNLREGASPYWATTAGADSTWSDIWSVNYTYSPQFINYASKEYHLKSTSPLRGLGVSVTDTQWGTTGETDLGAFKYYEISGGGGDITPPSLSGPLPSGTQSCTGSVNLQVTATDSTPPITCKYDTSSSATYDTMIGTMSCGSSSPVGCSATVALACNTSYTYYFLCADSVSPVNKDTITERVSTNFTISALAIPAIPTLSFPLNGAIGIARKVFGNSVVKQITNSGLAFNPIKINIF